MSCGRSAELDGAALPRRLIDGENDLKHSPAVLPGGAWIAVLLDRLDEVRDLRDMAGDADVGRAGAGGLAFGLAVRGPRLWRLIGEAPADDLSVLDHHGPLISADLKPLSEAREHRRARHDRADRARAEPQQRERDVFDLDVMGLGRADRRHLVDRSHAREQQVDIVNALVHQRATVERPGAGPRAAVVVRLAAVPLPA